MYSVVWNQCMCDLSNNNSFGSLLIVVDEVRNLIVFIFDDIFFSCDNGYMVYTVDSGSLMQ